MGYQGESTRSSKKRQSGATESATHTGTPPRTLWTLMKQNGDPARTPLARRFSLSFANGMLQIAAGPSDLEDAWYSSHAWKRIG